MSIEQKGLTLTRNKRGEVVIWQESNEKFTLTEEELAEILKVEPGEYGEPSRHEFIEACVQCVYGRNRAVEELPREERDRVIRSAGSVLAFIPGIFKS